jgi:hypothetical protein
MSDVGSDRCRNTQGLLTKNVKEIFCDLKFLSEVTGCRKTQVSNHTGSTVYNIYQNWMRQTEHTNIIF